MTSAHVSNARRTGFGTKLLIVGFLLSMAFPYIQLVRSESYTQPFYLVLGSIVAFRFWGTANRSLLRHDRFALSWLVWVGLFLFVVTCFPYTEAQEYKYLLNYLAPLVLTVATVAALQRFPKLTRKVLEVSVCVWFAVALMQTTISPSFMSWAIGSWSDSAEDVVNSGRGVLGLAPEPTHHGFHLLLLGASLALIGGKRWLPLICIFEAILLARSSSAVLVLALGVAFLNIKHPRRILLAAAMLALVIALFLRFSESFAENVRVLLLLSQFIDDPSSIITLDFSVNMRLGGAYASFHHALSHYLMPQGLSYEHWLAMGQEFLQRHEWLFDISTVGPPTGYGVLLLQGGFLVIPFIFLSMRTILRAPVDSTAGRLLLFSGVFIFLGQFYISSPMFSLLYGCAIHATLRRRAAWRTKKRLTREAAQPSMLLLPASNALATKSI